MMRRHELKECILSGLNSLQKNVNSAQMPAHQNSYLEKINWKHPSDQDLLYLMQMQVRGLDAQGDQMMKIDSQL